MKIRTKLFALVRRRHTRGLFIYIMYDIYDV